MGESTISMAMFNSKLLVYQRVSEAVFEYLEFLELKTLTRSDQLHSECWIPYYGAVRGNRPVLRALAMRDGSKQKLLC